MQSKDRSSKGSVVVDANKPKLRLRLPREVSRVYFNVEQKYISLGLDDTPENRKIAGFKAQQIENDLKWEQFDVSLNKYRVFNHLSVAPKTHTPEEVKRQYSPIALWEEYFESKRSSLKPTTIEKYRILSALYKKLGDIDVEDSVAVKAALEKVTTIARVKDGLMYLNAACKWGVKHNRIITNRYDGMYQEMPKYNYQVNPEPDSFTEEERERVIEAFKNHKGNWNGRGFAGISYARYAPFVEFLFLMGCRPSEAVGLQWKHVSDDCGTISFEGSITQVGNRRVRVKGSKNNKTRQLSVGQRIVELLQSIKPENVNTEDLVFPGDKGNPINYRNFSRRAWKAIVEPIKPDTTPYNCRDTFITLELLAGTPSAIVAQWCDTSTSMIDKNYADKLKLTQLRPKSHIMHEE